MFLKKMIDFFILEYDLDIRCRFLMHVEHTLQIGTAIFEDSYQYRSILVPKVWWKKVQGFLFTLSIFRLWCKTSYFSVIRIFVAFQKRFRSIKA